MQASTTAETIHFFHSVFSWWDYLLSNNLLDSIYRILSGTNMWSKLHCQRKKISLTVSTPVQLDDCWEEYLRESWSVRAVSELSVWDCRVIIKEVAQCHSHPQAVFFFYPGADNTSWAMLGHLGLSWGMQPRPPSKLPLGFSKAVYPTPSHSHSDSSHSSPYQSPGQ